MPRSVLTALTIVLLLAGGVFTAGQQEKKDAKRDQSQTVTILKVDAQKGALTAKFTDSKGKTQEKTFKFTKDIRLLDETGRGVDITVFESGQEALIVESAGQLRELRRLPHRADTRRLSDAVRTLIEMTSCEQGCAADLQKIYDMLRKLDTGKNGKIDPKALQAEADHILRERVSEVFKRLDTNKDGKISSSEARGLIKEHFAKIDTNQDGMIDFNELLTAARERRDHPSTEAQAKQKEKK